jgi:hypothetical protein
MESEIPAEKFPGQTGNGEYIIEQFAGNQVSKIIFIVVRCVCSTNEKY